MLLWILACYIFSNKCAHFLWILLHCLSLELKWKLTFSSPVATAEFSKYAGILSPAFSQHHLWWQNQFLSKASLVAQMVKNSLAMQETWVWFPGREDPLEKGMATHTTILAWRIPWTEELGLQSVGSQRVGHDWATNPFTFTGLPRWPSW